MARLGQHGAARQQASAGGRRQAEACGRQRAGAAAAKQACALRPLIIASFSHRFSHHCRSGCGASAAHTPRLAPGTLVQRLDAPQPGEIASRIEPSINRRAVGPRSSPQRSARVPAAALLQRTPLPCLITVQASRPLPLAAGWRPAGARQLAGRPARGGAAAVRAAKEDEPPKQQGHQAPASSAANLEVRGRGLSGRSEARASRPLACTALPAL